MKRFIVCMLLCLIPGMMQAQAGNLSSATPVFSPAAQTLTTTCTAGSTCPVITIAGMCVAKISVSGTFSVLALAVKGTNDGTNFTALNVTTIGATTLTKGLSITAAGLYATNVAALTKLQFVVSSFTGTNVVLKVTATSACSADLVTP
jgi:hypothetical protein